MDLEGLDFDERGRVAVAFQNEVAAIRGERGQRVGAEIADLDVAIKALGEEQLHPFTERLGMDEAQQHERERCHHGGDRTQQQHPRAPSHQLDLSKLDADHG